jgi:hypothetical protein
MYERIFAWDNLLLAYRRAAKGKRGHACVAAFEHRLEDNLLQLTAMLRALGPDGEGAAKVNSRVRSWVNHVRYGNTVGLRKAVFRTAARAAAGPRVADARI